MSHETARFDFPLLRNYDYGTGLYSNMDKFKSVEEFLNNRRKKRKIKANLRKTLLKNALSFGLEDNFTQNFGDIDPVGSSIVGGLYDKYLSYDFDGNPPEYLGFGRPEGFSEAKAVKNKELLDLLDSLFNGENTNFFGMPGGVPDSELDAVDTKQESYHDQYSEIIRDNENVPYSS